LGWLLTILLSVAAARLAAQVTIATHRYDPARVGANLSETVLGPATVNASSFGKLYSYPVDGSVYAQPLYVPRLTIGGTMHNVLFVATMNDKVYAFDADSTSSTPLWTRDFTNPPAVTPIPITDITGPLFNIVGNVGIQSTPVIDTSTGTIYLVARTKENGAYVQRLHALDLLTGASRPGSPVTITGSVPGGASDSVASPGGSVVVFNPKMQSQRAALALTNGVVLIAWASHEDLMPFHGWIMGYDAATLAKVATFCVTPDSYAGGIWQGGRAPTIDADGNAYFTTGNGGWDGRLDFGDSLLKFGVSTAGLKLLDYFTPGNYAALDSNDDDLSGSGFTLLPGTNMLLGGGKEGALYLLDAANLGHMVPNDTQIRQRIGPAGGHVMGGPVFWDSSTAGPLIYNWNEDDVLRAYRWTGSTLATPSAMEGAVVSPGHPGGSLTVSADGSRGGTGIVWASLPTSQNGKHGLVAGVLRAFNAETLTEIWNSEMNPSRDRAGTLMKFVPPVVVNGRVYMPNHDNAVSVYGLLPRVPEPNPSPDTISIDFVGNAPLPMDAAESAGVAAARNWNAATGAARATPLPLVDSTGAPTAATVTWSAPSGTWQLPTTDQPGNARMMKGYLDTANTSQVTVTVAGLPQASYDVYVYVDGDNKANDRSAAYTLSGAGLTTTTVQLTDAANTNFTGTFARADGSAGNYVLFTMTGSGFTLDAAPTTPVDATRRAPVNGIQIVRRPTTPRPGSGPGAAVSIDFVGNAVRMDPGEVAGAVPASHWNAAAGVASSAPLALVDETGAATAATVTWAAPDGTWMLPIADQPGSARMMKGYLETKSTATTTVTVAGLPQAPYDVYVYVDGDNGTADRGAAYTLSGPGIVTTTVNLLDAANTNFTGTFVRASDAAGNYVRFSIDATGFTLRAATTTPVSGVRRAPVNGIQVVPVAPEPPRLPIGVDFSADATVVMAATESAGVVPQSHWNVAAGPFRTAPLSLVDRSGAATGASVTWLANGVWTLPIIDAPGDARMMRGYLDTSSTSQTTVTVSGLRAGPYDVYVYIDGDNKLYTRTASYRLTAGGVDAVVGATDTANVNFGGTFTQASDTPGNYVKFAITGDGFTLVATPVSGTNSTLRAPVNAIQIVPR